MNQESRIARLERLIRLVGCWGVLATVAFVWLAVRSWSSDGVSALVTAREFRMVSADGEQLLWVVRANDKGQPEIRLRNRAGHDAWAVDSDDHGQGRMWVCDKEGQSRWDWGFDDDGQAVALTYNKERQVIARLAEGSLGVHFELSNHAGVPIWDAFANEDGGVTGVMNSKGLSTWSALTRPDGTGETVVADANEIVRWSVIAHPVLGGLAIWKDSQGTPTVRVVADHEGKGQVVIKAKDAGASKE